MSEFEEKECVCRTCGQAFQNRFGLNAHMRRHVREVSRGPPFQPTEPYIPIDVDRISEQVLEQTRSVIQKQARIEIEKLATQVIKNTLAKMAGIELAPMANATAMPQQSQEQRSSVPSLSELEYTKLLREFTEREKAERELLESQKNKPFAPSQYQSHAPSQDSIELKRTIDEMKKKF